MLAELSTVMASWRMFELLAETHVSSAPRSPRLSPTATCYHVAGFASDGGKGNSLSCGGTTPLDETEVRQLTAVSSTSFSFDSRYVAEVGQPSVSDCSTELLAVIYTSVRKGSALFTEVDATSATLKGLNLLSDRALTLQEMTGKVPRSTTHVSRCCSCI
jgi:hypothetical protein